MCRWRVGVGPLTVAAATACSQFFYLEAVDLVRRIILTGALLIIRDRIITFRLIGALLISLLWLTFLLTTYPYKHFQLDVISIASAFTLVCIYVGGLLVKLHNDLRVNFGAYVGARLTTKDIIDTVFATLSFHKTDTIVLLMVLFTLSVLIIVIATLGQQLWANRHEKILRVHGGECPELTLLEGHRWHLFLSHSEWHLFDEGPLHARAHK